ncbi:unnamed protein product [Lymnaea stagnalis]|uniref:Secreted protein n=1 Tax=Lymnaea stagnalis TaxID=6523 RepID=A0AAV2HH10_LYMST
MLRLALTVFSTAYNFLLNIIFNRNFRRGFEALFTCRHLVVRKNAVHPMGAAAATYAERGSREGQNTTSLFTLSLKPRSAIVK